ncbi:hypothetical protein BGZ47_002732 [Haplosporangium gracile]|nr:hypothetical protein BGZ47_002732 [Haplosporangium gracile]
MRHPLKFNWTLGSTVLLSLALLSHLVTLGEASISRQGASAAIDDLNSNSLFWKRDRLSRLSSDSPSIRPHFQTGSGSLLRKRSLFSHVNDDIVVPPSPPTRLPAVNRRRPHLINTSNRVEEGESVVRVRAEVTHDGSREREAVVQTHNNNKFDHSTTTTTKHNNNNNNNNNHNEKDVKVSETTYKLNFSPNDNDDEEDEERTLIEPHYPSIDLFDEEELLEVGEDGILREKGHHQSSSSSSSRSSSEDKGEDRHDQGWLVDEWEEELEGDMDEWMDWVEEDHALNRINAEKDKDRLRDQSAMDSLVFDEDEASPFQRLFSDSWLF